MKIEIEGDSAEAVAFALLRMVMEAEGRDDEDAKDGVTKAWLLDTYVECLAAVNGARLVADDEDDDEDGDEDKADDGDDADADEEDDTDEDEDEDAGEAEPVKAARRR